MLFIKQIVEKSYNMFEDSLKFGNPEYRYIFHALTYSLLILEEYEKLNYLKLKANSLFFAYNKTKNKKHKNMIESKLLNLINDSKKYIIRANIISEDSSNAEINSPTDDMILLFDENV